MLLKYTFEKEIPNMEFSNVDMHKFNISKKSRYKTPKAQSEDNFVQLYDSPITIDFYVLDNDGVYKKGNPVDIIQNVMTNNNSNIEIEGNRFDHFLDMLKRSPNYIRSYIVNGERFFETNKQTPKGVVVIGNKRNQP